MNAMRNVVHALVLAGWALLGVLFTLKCVFGGALLAGLLSAGGWWLWFAGFAALTTWAVLRFAGPLAALLVHGGAFLLLSALPPVFPLRLLRLGLDLLAQA